jgi:hypothetical protein
MRDGFVPINIKFIDRADYYTAFNEFNQSAKTKTMENIIGKALTNSYHKRLAYFVIWEPLITNFPFAFF